MGCLKISMAVILTAVVVAGLAEAQSDTPSCAQELVPCMDYLNSTTTPPESCCKPIREVVASEKDCLCQLFNSPGFLDSLGITMTQALRLTQSCSVDADANLCQDIAPSPAVVPPPPGMSGNGAVGVMTWTGVSSLLLSVVFVMLY